MTREYIVWSEQWNLLDAEEFELVRFWGNSDLAWVERMTPLWLYTILERRMLRHSFRFYASLGLISRQN